MIRRLARATGKTLIGFGSIVVAFAVFQLWGTGIEASRHQDELGVSFAQTLGASVRSNAERAAARGSDAAAAAVIDALSKVQPTTAPPLAAPAEGNAIGVIEIPAIGLTRYFVEGVTKADLRKGPGHYPETPLPGQAGNAAIAGHRTTYSAPFNRIDELQPGDAVYVTTRQGRFRYEVLPPPEGKGIERGPGWFTVRPTDVSVLAASSENLLTLTACHPKRSAAQRIVVRARLTSDVAAAARDRASERSRRNTEGSTSDGGKGRSSASAEDSATSTATRPAATSAEAMIAGDDSAKWPTVAAGAVFLGILALQAWLARTRRRWLVRLIASPFAAVALLCCFVFLDRWLPSL